MGVHCSSSWYKYLIMATKQKTSVEVEYCRSGGFDSRYRQLRNLINEVDGIVMVMVMVAKVAPVAEVKGRVGRRGAFELLVNGQMVYSRLVTGKFPDFNATAAMVSKVEAGAEPEKILKHSPSSCTIL